MPTATKLRAITDRPFAGLNYYTENDAKWFFGRVAERTTIVGNLRSARLTLLYADSGVGKSSLLRAGVASGLLELAHKHREARGSAQYVPILFSAWKDEPVDALIRGIETRINEFLPDGAKVALPGDQLDEAITTAAGAVDATLLIILDQFEEYFLSRTSEAQPGGFSDQFARCVNSPDVRANFLISIREDAYSGLGDLFASRIHNVYGNYLHLEYLDRASAREAIEGPIAAFNKEHAHDPPVEIDGALTDKVLDEVARGKLTLGPGSQDGAGHGEGKTGDRGEIEAPFLQLVMERLWEEVGQENGTRTLRKETLERLGGADKIVRAHLDEALASLGDDELETATLVFHELITPSGTKIAHTVADLATMTHQPVERVGSVVKKLDDARVFRGVEPAPGMSEWRYEIFHDRLARPLLDWLEVRDRERLQKEADAEARSAKRFRRRAIVAGIAALVAFVLLIVAFVFRQNAIDATHVAQSELLATRATANPNLELASLLALEAYRVSPTVEARGAILAVASSRELGAPLRSPDWVYTAVFSPTGTTLASSSADGTVRLWDAASHRQLGAPLGAPVQGHRDRVFSVAFSPDGRTLASGNEDGTIRLWDVASHRQLGAPIAGRLGIVHSVAFSRNGRTLASGIADTVRVWDVASHRQLGAPFRDHHGKAHLGTVYSVAFSPDGRMLASGSADKTIRLWDVARHRQLGSALKRHGDFVFSVAFSPDGRTLASGSADNRIRLWNVATHRQVALLLGHSSTVHSVAFSPDGRTLASGAYDNTIRLWDIRSHKQLGAPLTGHNTSVLSVAFNPEGTKLASGSSDDTVRLWNLAVTNGRETGPPLTGHTDTVEDVAFSPDGRTLASGSADTTIRLWDVFSHQQIGHLNDSPKKLKSVAFSRDGKRLVSGGSDYTVRLWDVPSRSQLPPPLGGGIGTVNQVAFSPTGKTLASGSADGTVRLWDPVGHQELGKPFSPQLTGPSRQIETIAFSPDGRMLASGADDSTVRLWDVRSHRQLRAPQSGDKSPVLSVAFSPDGETLASGSTDGTIRLWDVASHRQIGSLAAAGGVEGVAFSRDGRTLASGSNDGTVQFWDVASHRQLGPALTRGTGGINAVAFDPSGTILAAGGADRTISLWNYYPINVYIRQLCGYIDPGQAQTQLKKEDSSIPFHKPC